MKNKFISLALCLCMALTLLPATALAADYTGWDSTVTYSVDDNITIGGVSYAYKGDVSTSDLDLTTPGTGNTVYKAGDGYVLWEPSDKKLTLNSATTTKNITLSGTCTLALNGSSSVQKVILYGSAGHLTIVAAAGASLNADYMAADSITGDTSVLKAIVSTYVAGSTSDNMLTIYGSWNLPDSGSLISKNINIDTNATVTVDDTNVVFKPAGASDPCTVTNNGRLIVKSGKTLNLSGCTTVENAGTIENNGTLALPAGFPAANIAALALTGSGMVNAGSKSYLNDGTEMNVVTGDLDFTGLTPPGNGYVWDSTSKTLTLDNLYMNGTLILPLEATIVTNSRSTVKSISMTQTGTQLLTFSGTAPLTVNGDINSSQNIELIVATGAKLNVNGRIGIGTSGGKNGLLTINGKLSAYNPDFSSIACGKIVIGGSGELSVSGAGGARINGMDSTGYAGAFTIMSGGKFSGNCTSVNVFVFAGNDVLSSDDANQAVVLPAGYLPADYAIRVVSGVNGSMQQYAAAIAKNTDSLVLSAESVSGAGGSLNLQMPTSPSRNDNGRKGNGGGVSASTLTFEVNDGSEIESISVTRGTTVDLNSYNPTKAGYNFDGWYMDRSLTERVTSVKMTKNISVYAKWAAKAVMSFVDVPENSYYRDAVIWAFDKGITQGTGSDTFSPNNICTRAQAVTFLWRTNGSPAPKTDVMLFTDVPVGSYCYDAVLWAVEQGIINGSAESLFAPDMGCSRANIVTMLWRMEGSEVVTAANPFVDVSDTAYYADAVLWAVEQGITEGTSANTFSPDDNCTRAQVDTFIYRAMK